MTAPVSLAHYAGPVLVTLGYCTVYYALHSHGLRTKRHLGREYRARGERFDRYFGQDRKMLAADRYVLNMLEHMPPFLAVLWLHAVFVSPRSATLAGSAYVVTRIAYPFLMGPRLERFPPRVLLATLTGYAVQLYLALTVAWAAVRAL